MIANGESSCRYRDPAIKDWLGHPLFFSDTYDLHGKHWSVYRHSTFLI